MERRSFHGIYLSNSLSGRVGRKTRSPRQFGHIPPSSTSGHVAQKVHSPVQIRASAAPFGRLFPQRSHVGRISKIAIHILPLYKRSLHSVLLETLLVYCACADLPHVVRPTMFLHPP